MFLSKQWQDEREQAMRNSAVIGDYTQEELNLTDEDIGGKYNPDTFIAKTTPIDSLTESTEYDIRDDPKIGY